MRLRPGSFLWLLASELRLDWRRRTERRPGRRAALWITASVPLVLALLVGIPLGLALRGYQPPVDATTALTVNLALAAYGSLMLAQALGAAVEAFYTRGDLDLLFSSPVAPQRVLAVRILAIAFSAFSIFGFFTVPPLLVVALIAHPSWIAAIGVIFALALTASAAAVCVASLLLRWLGPRRTRMAAHGVAAGVGALFFLGSQGRLLLGDAQSARLNQALSRFARSPEFHVPGFDWPLRALFGEALPLLASIGVGTGALLAAVVWIGPGFAGNVARAAGADAPRRRAAALRPFAQGVFAAALRKELRLITRDPALFTQVLVRIVYLAPLGFLALRSGGAATGLAAAAGGLAFMSNQLAGSLAWMTLSAEDAPDLLASAPAAPGLLRRAKLAAVALGVGIPLAPGLLPLIIVSPLTGTAAVAGCVAATISATLINIWRQRLPSPTEFRNRRNGSWFVTLVELALGLMIGAATSLLAIGSAWCVAPALVSLGVLVALRPSAASKSLTGCAAQIVR